MKVESAQVSWLESGLPYSTQFQDVYYSRDDEIAESRHVFIEANKLSQRWKNECHAPSFHLGELGFGSGLNFLQVMQLWSELPTRPDRLHYIAFEKYPLTVAQLGRIHQRWPSLSLQSEELLEQYPDHSEGCHRISLTNGITLDLYYGDASTQLQERLLDACPAINCWFLDGFSPANNIELWEQALMQQVADCSDATTTLSTYSVAGKVRGALKKAGFEVSKIEGFGRKRHCLFASFKQDKNDSANYESLDSFETPWFILPRPHFGRNTALVVGAGLAGCSTAHSLAKRGWEVTVLDAAAKPANGASGNSQLALRCRLYNTPSTEAKFFLQAYLFALRQFQQLARRKGLNWNPCGVLQLVSAINKQNPLQADRLERLYSEQVVHALTRDEATNRAGLALQEAAWFFPSGGAIDPASLCESYLSHPNIQRAFNTRVSNLEYIDKKWQINAKQFTADVVVIANSQGATQFEQCSSLPLQALRGQTTEIAANEKSRQLKTVINGPRSIFPEENDRHLLSASYANSTELESWPDDNLQNIDGASANFADKEMLGKNIQIDRISLRCNTPDRLPLIGLVPDAEQMRSTFIELSRNAKAKFTSPGIYHPGLYINIAHGSNGLASCPLSAEFLASLISNENLPLSRDMVNMLNPTRFLIKDLKKQR